MLDPNFDPLGDLQLLKHNTNQLINSHNNHDTAISVICTQHNRINKLINEQQKEITRLKAEIAMIKQSMTK